MFGYVNVNRDQLSDEDKKIYQSYYCGLCRCLKEHFGKKGQLLLNYDVTFLVLLLTGLYECEETEEPFTCKIHPTRRLTAKKSDIMEYGAYMNVLLAYYNLMDDYKDSKKLTRKKLADRLYPSYQRAAELYPRQARAVEGYMQRLSAYESEQEENIDLVASLTGNMLGELFAMKEDEWYDELKTFGLYLGKFIYLMDAYEDLKKDKKTGSYNPLVKASEEQEDFETLVRLMMTSMMAECAKSFERLPILLHAEIMRNVIYSGVWTRYEMIQIRRKNKAADKSKKSSNEA